MRRCGDVVRGRWWRWWGRWGAERAVWLLYAKIIILRVTVSLLVRRFFAAKYHPCCNNTYSTFYLVVLYLCSALHCTVGAYSVFVVSTKSAYLWNSWCKYARVYRVFYLCSWL
jgi:hypothetical protein